jgi:hypothetical protein
MPSMSEQAAQATPACVDAECDAYTPAYEENAIQTEPLTSESLADLGIVNAAIQEAMDEAAHNRLMATLDAATQVTPVPTVDQSTQYDCVVYEKAVGPDDVALVENGTQYERFTAMSSDAPIARMDIREDTNALQRLSEFGVAESFQVPSIMNSLDNDVPYIIIVSCVNRKRPCCALAKQRVHDAPHAPHL